uniref:cellulose binding domain-containing protein n=1 Tax=Streptomyces sp. TRM64462 TaxID=2741726 RepID=UPI001585EF1E
VTYAVQNQWSGGFTAQVTVRNTGTAPVDGWRVGWTWPSGQSVTQAWNAAVGQSDAAVTAANVAYNSVIPAGGTVTFGFNGAWSGANTAPAAFTLNSADCTAG